MPNSSNKSIKSNIELLRVFLAFAIILSHLSSEIESLFDKNVLSLNRVFTQSMTLGGLANNIFIILSGYLMINKETISIKRYLSLYIEFMLYGLLNYLVKLFFLKEGFSILGLLKVFFPLTSLGTKLSWFGTYFIFCLFIPFINHFVRTTEKSFYDKLLITMAVIWCVIPTFTLGEYQWSFLAHFFFMYLIGGYIRLFKDNVQVKNIYIYILIVFFLIVISYILFDYVGVNNEWIFYGRLYFSSWRKMPMVILSILIFMLFKNMKMKSNGLINFIGRRCFGIILSHVIFLNNVQILLKSIISNRYYVIFFLLLAILLFVVSLMIESIRLFIFNSRFDNYLEKILLKIKNKIIAYKSK